MTFKTESDTYEIIIEKKKTTKNTYIRVKDDLKIYVTANILTPKTYIEKLILENHKAIENMIKKQIKKNNNNSDFHYLGKRYEIVYTNTCDIYLGDDKVFLNKNYSIEKWYKKQAKEIFQESLDKGYNSFSRSIPYPSLRIRKMTTRWGVCNTKSKTITLNLELIKRSSKYLDYVIIHELSHLIYPDHSKKFWDLVEENCPNYKKIRSEMKEF